MEGKVIKRKILSKLIILVICAYKSIALAAVSSGVEATGLITSVNKIDVITNGISITTSDSGAGVFNGENAFKLHFSNNNSSGYSVNVAPTNGYFVIDSYQPGSGDPVDGDIINYKLSCQRYHTLASTPELISRVDKVISGTNEINIYSVTNPDAATCVSNSEGCQAPPKCHIQLADDEDIDEHFNGTFSETLTYEIVNQA